MEVVDKLVFNLDSYLNSKGFQDLKNEIKGSKTMFSSLQSVAGSTLGKLAMGYFTITGLVGQYRKAIEASNFQLEQQTKLFSTLRGQNFEDYQIRSIIDYASELQKLGVVSDEVTLAGVQQLATYNLTEENLKKLIPAMQDVVVQQKGLKGTGQDAVGVANMLAKGLLGQTGILQKAGITLTEYQEKMIKTGKQEEKVAALVEAVRMNVGEQNKEFLKTPEGKIISAQNRIGDLYEYWGMLVRDTRAEFWSLVADNAEGIKDIVGKAFKGGAAFVDTFMGVFRDVRRGFNALPDGAKTGLKGITAYVLATKFPLVALALAIEDIFAAFQGKEAFTKDAIDGLLKFTGTDYKFEDLRKEVSSFFDIITKKTEELPEKMGNVTRELLEWAEVTKLIYNIGKIGLGFAFSPVDIADYVSTYMSEGKEKADKRVKYGIAYRNIAGGINGIVEANESSRKLLERDPEFQKYIKNIEERKNRDFTNDIIKKGNEPSLEKEILEKETMLLPDFKNLDKQNIQNNKEVKIESKPVINVSYTIHEATDIEKIKKETEKGVRKALEEQERELRYIVGGSLSNGGGAF